MIRFTGDTHGEQGRFFELGTMGEETWTEKDTLIVCGDFGYVFKNDSIENVFLNELEKKKYTICFCCGNHENFDALFQYKQEIWNVRIEKILIREVGYDIIRIEKENSK